MTGLKPYSVKKSSDLYRIHRFKLKNAVIMEALVSMRTNIMTVLMIAIIDMMKCTVMRVYG